MTTLALFFYYIWSTVLLVAAIVAAGFGLSRLETKIRALRAHKADRPNKNTARALCEKCGDEFPVGFHTHKLKQGRQVIGLVAHLDAADIELHGLTCKGRG